MLSFITSDLACIPCERCRREKKHGLAGPGSKGEGGQRGGTDRACKTHEHGETPLCRPLKRLEGRAPLSELDACPSLSRQSSERQAVEKSSDALLTRCASYLSHLSPGP